MKTKRVILKCIGVLILASLAVTSCIDDPEPPALDVLPDVFMQKRMVDGEVKYGLSFWVFGNKDLQSVTVEGPESGTWPLQADAVKRLFTFYPEVADYTDTMPEQGDYIFTVTSTQTGEASRTFTDKLEEKELDVAIIDSASFNNAKLYVSWETVNDADLYYIRLYDESDRLIFQSERLNKDETDFSFGLNDNGWVDIGKKAENGDTYRFEVVAILYESGSTELNKDYNVQCISITSGKIIWGV